MTRRTLTILGVGLLVAAFFAFVSHAGPAPSVTQIGQLPKLPAATDPDAPPVSPEVRELINRYMGVHSTSEWFRFNTLREAAIYATTRAEQCSHYYECSGVIAVDPKDGRFVVTPVHTDYQSDNVRIMLEDAPSDWTTVATFHSHPCLPHHANYLFSPADLIGSITHRLSNYMVDLCTGDVHEFIIGKDKPDTVFHDNIWMTGGTVIGTIEAFPEATAAHEGI